MATSSWASHESPGLDGSAQQGWRPGDPLSQPEMEVLDKANAGDLLDLGGRPDDPPVAEAWGPERTIRAAVLQHLLVAKKWDVRAKGVRIRGARISGCLNLEAATLRCPLRLENCFLDGPRPVFDYATASLLALNGCRLSGFTGDTLTVTKGLYFFGSTFTGPLDLPGANITGMLACSGVQLAVPDQGGVALRAVRMKVDGGVFLEEGFTAAGAVRLVRANITGNLECSSARLEGADGDGNALAADGLKVGGDVLLNQASGQKFTAAGVVSFVGADITGNLSCSGARLDGANDDGNALVADGLKVGGSVFLNEGFTAAGVIRLVRANVAINLDCSNAQLKREGNALVANGLKVGGDVLLNQASGQKFTAAGAVSLVGADITGNLECSSARLDGANDDGNALVADGLKVGGDVFLNAGFTAAGAISLLGADIAGNLECSGAQLTREGKDGNVLIADVLKVGHDMFLDEGFTAAGAISLLGANITANLECRGAQLNRADGNGNALVAGGLKVGGDMFLDEGFTAAGTVSLQSVSVGGSLLLSLGEPAEVKAGKSASVKPTTALDATGAQVTHRLGWWPAEQVAGLVILEDAAVGQLEDSWQTDEGPRPNGYWARADKGLLRLDGFTYARCASEHEQQATLEQRLAWIGSQPVPTWGARLLTAIRAPRQAWSESKDRRASRRARAAYGFTPQPYEQLANVYQQAGQNREARMVALARRRDLRFYGNLTPYRKALNWLLDKTIEYGYQTWRAVVGITALYIVIFLLFRYAQHRTGLIVPVQPVNGLSPKPTAAICTSNYPCFSPIGYAIDTVIPIINVHQANYWGPNASAHLGWFFVYASWVGIVLGWAFATLAVAGYTGLVRNTDSL